MNIQLIERVTGTTAQYFTIGTDRQTTSVTIHKDGRVGVLVHNASHRAWRGFGKTYNSQEKALEQFRGDKTRAAIRYAAELAAVHAEVSGNRA